MRKLITTCMVAAAILVIASFTSPSAEAMTVPAPVGLNATIHDTSPLRDVAYICRRV